MGADQAWGTAWHGRCAGCGRPPQGARCQRRWRYNPTVSAVKHGPLPALDPQVDDTNPNNVCDTHHRVWIPWPCPPAAASPLSFQKAAAGEAAATGSVAAAQEPAPSRLPRPPRRATPRPPRHQPLPSSLPAAQQPTLFGPQRSTPTSAAPRQQAAAAVQAAGAQPLHRHRPQPPPRPKAPPPLQPQPARAPPPPSPAVPDPDGMAGRQEARRRGLLQAAGGDGGAPDSTPTAPAPEPPAPGAEAGEDPTLMGSGSSTFVVSTTGVSYNTTEAGGPSEAQLAPPCACAALLRPAQRRRRNPTVLPCACDVQAPPASPRAATPFPPPAQPWPCCLMSWWSSSRESRPRCRTCWATRCACLPGLAHTVPAPWPALLSACAGASSRRATGEAPRDQLSLPFPPAAVPAAGEQQLAGPLELAVLDCRGRGVPGGPARRRPGAVHLAALAHAHAFRGGACEA